MSDREPQGPQLFPPEVRAILHVVRVLLQLPRLLARRKTSLYDRVLQFDLTSPPTGSQPPLRLVK